MRTEHTDHDTDRPTQPTTLEMPRQAPPIDRTGTTTGAYDDTAGVEPDGFLDTLSKILQI
ncbi:hypothetical protein [Streptomyces sp. NPDC050355]|uniref:Uncharacterized protein n=1 Tax=Streptomyces sirii TaxID=3127701 RepID=A0ABZ2QXI8_9ACTN